MSNLLQNVQNFFTNAWAWGATLPQYIAVPLIIVLTLVGTAAVVSLILGLIRLIFGQKAIDNIKNISQHLNNASNGVNAPKNGQ